MSNYVYILQCNDQSLYTGATKNLAKREAVHNQGKGARYTRCRLPVKIVYFQECESWSIALKKEYKIKKMSRREKILLINQYRDKFKIINRIDIGDFSI